MNFPTIFINFAQYSEITKMLVIHGLGQNIHHAKTRKSIHYSTNEQIMTLTLKIQVQ